MANKLIRHLGVFWVLFEVKHYKGNLSDIEIIVQINCHPSPHALISHFFGHTAGKIQFPFKKVLISIRYYQGVRLTNSCGIKLRQGFPGGSDGKESVCYARDPNFLP